MAGPSTPGKLSRIVFVVFFALLGLLVGAKIGSLFAAKEGFTGGPIVLMYGLIGCAAAVLSGIVIARKVSHAGMKIWLYATGSALVLLIAWLAYRVSVAASQ